MKSKLIKLVKSSEK